MTNNKTYNLILDKKPPISLRLAAWCNRWTRSQLWFVVIIAAVLIATNLLAVYRLDQAREIINLLMK